MNTTFVGDPSATLSATPAFSGNTGILRFLNYSPYALNVDLRRGAFVVPPYCPRDLIVDVYENIAWKIQYQLTGVSKNPASYLVIEAYDENEKIPALPPSFSCPLVNIGNTTPVATSAQQVDATFSTSTTTPQVMTATAGTGLGVQDQKASGYIELYPTATDATARGIALAYIDTSGTLHVGAYVNNVGDFAGLRDITLIPATLPSFWFNATIPSTTTDINGILDIQDNTASAIHWQAGKQSHANGDNFRIIDATNGKLGIAIAPNGAGMTVLGAMQSLGGQATAGSFGVPPMVAQALRQSVTVTTAVNLLTFAIPANGTYRINVSWVFSNTTNGTKPRLVATYTAPNAGSTSDPFLAQDANGNVHIFDGVGASTATLNGTFTMNVIPRIIEANSGANLVVTYTAGGVPNDLLSVIVERLA